MLSRSARTNTPPPAPGLTCPTCRGTLAVEDVNVQQGVALCRACAVIVRLTDIAENLELSHVDTNTPPKGCAVADIGHEQIVTASTRSVGGFFGCLFACLFWNGIVSVFVLVNIASTLKHLGLALPAWFPAPTPSNMPLGMTLFLWVFLTPFIAVGLVIFAGVLLCLAGRIEVRMRGGEGVVFTGAGTIGWRRRFDLSKVARVTLQRSKADSDSATKTEVLIAADRDIKFGSGLPEERKLWLAAVLQRLLVHR